MICNGMRTLILLVSTTLLACGAPDASVTASGVSFPTADSLFHQDAQWLGSDGAYSVDLGGARVAWFFGDTFIATSAAYSRSVSKMPRNTIAVQSGLDPTSATMEFAWKRAADGTPISFFPEDGSNWHWPGGGVRVPGGPLIVFLSVITSSSGGLGFSGIGWQVAVIANPDDSPAAWRATMFSPPSGTGDFTLGTAVARDGEFADVLAIDSSHHGFLARFPLAALAMGDLASMQWWSGGAWASATSAPAQIIDDAGSEASLHFSSSLNRWVHIASRGFGATTIAVRTASAVTGPWSSAQDAFTPPEDSAPAPFVYAGKAHPELTTPDGTLAVTYATNSFTF